MPAAGNADGFVFDTPPLVVPKPVFAQEVLAAKLRLDEPLFEAATVRALLSLCLVADTLIERVHRVERDADVFDPQILSDIEALCKAVAPQQHAHDTLDQLGLLGMFPYLYQGLSGERLEDAAQHYGASYLAYITQLNQVVMLGSQLYYDACIPEHHKYSAHQIALLYQTLNQLQGDTKPIRRLVEARFDEIKQITESRDPYMPIELATWLQGVTWLCREEVRLCPPYIHRRLEPILRLLAFDSGLS